MLMFILTTVVLVFTNSFARDVFPIKNQVQFAIIGDRTGGADPGVFNSILEEIDLLKPECTITVGDMIEGYTEDLDRLNKEWTEYKKIIDGHSSPIYHTPGNHDITFDAMEESYRDNIGKPYYSFNHEDIHFVILDVSRSNNSVEIPEEQIKWLKKDLKKKGKKAACTIVFMHKPFWYPTIADSKPDLLHDIFKEYGVDAVFTGHYHHYFSGEYDGIIYTSLGSSGGGTYYPIDLLNYHYTWVTVDRDGIHIAPIKMGSVQKWDVITAKDTYIVQDMMEKTLIVENEIRCGKDYNITDETVMVTVKNLNPDQLLDDVVVLDLPAGWTATSTEIPVKIEPGTEKIVSFSVSSSGRLFPSPKVTINSVYRDENKVKLETTLRLSREVECSAVAVPPVIDGKLNEDIWIAPETILFAPDGGEVKVEPTEFYFSHDDKFLYLGAKATDSRMDSIFSSATERDGAVYGDDCIGYFLVPDLEKGTMFQIYVNPDGVIFDVKFWIEEGKGYQTDRDWNGKLEIKTSRSDDSWSMEASIPLSELGVETPNKEWRVNFRRKQFNRSAMADWQVPIAGDPNNYGVLVVK